MLNIFSKKAKYTKWQPLHIYKSDGISYLITGRMDIDTGEIFFDTKQIEEVIEDNPVKQLTTINGNFLDFKTEFNKLTNREKVIIPRKKKVKKEGVKEQGEDEYNFVCKALNIGRGGIVFNKGIKSLTKDGNMNTVGHSQKSIFLILKNDTIKYQEFMIYLQKNYDSSHITKSYTESTDPKKAPDFEFLPSINPKEIKEFMDKPDTPPEIKKPIPTPNRDLSLPSESLE